MSIRNKSRLGLFGVGILLMAPVLLTHLAYCIKTIQPWTVLENLSRYWVCFPIGLCLVVVVIVDIVFIWLVELKP